MVLTSVDGVELWVVGALSEMEAALAQASAYMQRYPQLGCCVTADLPGTFWQMPYSYGAVRTIKIRDGYLYYLTHGFSWMKGEVELYLRLYFPADQWPCRNVHYLNQFKRAWPQAEEGSYPGGATLGFIRVIPVLSDRAERATVMNRQLRQWIDRIVLLSRIQPDLFGVSKSTPPFMAHLTSFSIKSC